MHNRNINFGKYSFFTSFNSGNTLLTEEKEGEASFMKLDKIFFSVSFRLLFWDYGIG